MALLHIPLDNIKEGHLRALIGNGARESLYIEYKRETYGDNDAAKKEFLADISSFANAAGGDLVIGMKEGQGDKKGIPIDIVPFTDGADDELRRLEDMARDGIEPRISGLRIHFVEITAGGVVFVVRVPKSYNPPHRVILKGSNRFHARSSGGKYEPNIEELRQLFLAAPHLAERIRAFRMERIARIAANETPVPLISESPGRAVLHIVPYSAFGGFDQDLMEKVSENRMFFPPYARRQPTVARINFDGLLTLSNSDEDPAEHASYCQVFRNGAVEAVGNVPTDSPVSAYQFEGSLLDSVSRLAQALERCDIRPLYVVMFSLIGVKDAQLGITPGFKQPARQDQYHFTEALLDTVPTSTEEASTPLRPLLDHVASLSGAISM